MAATSTSKNAEREAPTNTQQTLISQMDSALQAGSPESIALIAEQGLTSVAGSQSESNFWTAFLNVANLILYEGGWNTDELRIAIQALYHPISTIDTSIVTAIVLQVKLSNKLNDRYERTGQLDDLDLVISWLEWRLRELPPDHFHRVVWLCKIMEALHTRHHRTLSNESISQALVFSEELNNPKFSSHPDFALAMAIKYNLLVSHSATGDEELERIFETAQDAASSIPPDSHVNDSLLDTRLMWLEKRYKSLRERHYLDKALSLAERGVSMFAADPNTHARWLSNHALNLERRFDLDGNTQDLNHAVRILERSLELTEDDDPSLPLRLSNLVATLQRRYQRTGDLNDLHLAVSYSDKSVERTHFLEPAKASSWMRQMARILWTRYDQTNTLEDLKLALARAHQALSVTPQSPEDIQDCRALLGSIYSTMFSRTHDPMDMDQALAYYALTISENPHGQSMRIDILEDDAMLLGSCYNMTKDVAYLDAPITMMRMVLEARKETAGSRRWGNTSLALADLLLSRYQNTGNDDELNEAIRHCHNALHTTENDLPQRSKQLWLAAKTLGVRYEKHRNKRDMQKCVKLLQKALKLPSEPLHLINTGRRAISLLACMMGEMEQADSVAEETLRLLPLLCGRNLNRCDQQFVMEHCQGLVSFSCALSLHKGDVIEALQRVEFGRGVVLGHLIDKRNDLSELEISHAELAERYMRLQDMVFLNMNELPPALQEKACLDRQNAAIELATLEEEIRGVPGFADFNMHPTVEQYQEYAAEGYVVIVNVINIRADAIIVSKSGIEHVLLELEKFLSDDAPQKLRKAMNYVVLEDRDLVQSYVQDGKAQDGMLPAHDIPKSAHEEGRQGDSIEGCLRNISLEQDDGSDAMEWLWLSCVEPVLRRLPLSQSPHRVWWIGCGYASSLPFHAAGRYVDGKFEGCIDRTISSYTTTIKALNYTRDLSSRVEKSQDGNQSLLLVTMPTTPGQCSLPGVEDEEGAVRVSVEDKASVISLKHPSAREVLDRIGECNITHFACHGVSDAADPSESHILLQRKDQSGELVQCVDKLKVSAILDVVSPGKASIAYLSACSTAESKSEMLNEEGIHLSSAFQIAGFPHVVGSLWPVRDEACVLVACLFYQNLVRDGGPGLRKGAVAEALRNSLLELRKSSEFDVRSWAPFVHFGP